MMSNEDLVAIFEELAQLKELSGENSFAANAYRRAGQNLERAASQFTIMLPEEREQLLGKSMAAKATGWHEAEFSLELEELRSTIPPGVLQMLAVPGFGVKKVGTLWRTHNITEFEDLVARALEGSMASLPGFGKGTQEAFLKYVETSKERSGKWRLNHGIRVTEEAIALLQGLDGVSDAIAVGDVARSMEIINRAEVLVGITNLISTKKVLSVLTDFVVDRTQSGPSAYRGLWGGKGNFTLYTCAAQDFAKEQVLLTGPEHFLNAQGQSGSTVRASVLKSDIASGEYDLVEKVLGFYVEPELRDNIEARPKEGERLITEADIKGILHCHSTYSDGNNTLREMALKCKELGYSYFGIADHSQTATYAQGLDEERVLKQWEEIDALNIELAPFRIFKGIESDILGDGSLDYPSTLLAGFEFIVASVHSNLKMTVEKATTRLLAAIENPYTTILGHATGRLLLERDGYPLNLEAIFDACAAHNVSIEINASPYRLDLDWRYVHQARKKGVQISINPDAHKFAGFDDMPYGVSMGRKGGLLPQECLNCLTTIDFAAWLDQRKKIS